MRSTAIPGLLKMACSVRRGRSRRGKRKIGLPICIEGHWGQVDAVQGQRYLSSRHSIWNSQSDVDVRGARGPSDRWRVDGYIWRLRRKSGCRQRETRGLQSPHIAIGGIIRTDEDVSPGCAAVGVKTSDAVDDPGSLKASWLPLKSWIDRTGFVGYGEVLDGMFMLKP